MPASGSPGIVGGRDADHDAGVGVALVAGILAHAVGDDAPRLGGRGHHGAARAHAEAVDRAAVRAVMHELVVGGAQPRMAGSSAVAAAVDERLRMLDAQADGERLRLDRNAALLEHLKRIAGAVADRQHDMIGRDVLAVGEHHARRPAAAVRPHVDLEVVDFALEAIFAAERLDGLADVFHHRHQPEGADVRLGDDRGSRAARRP